MILDASTIDMANPVYTKTSTEQKHELKKKNVRGKHVFVASSLHEETDC